MVLAKRGDIEDIIGRQEKQVQDFKYMFNDGIKKVIEKFNSGNYSGLVKGEDTLLVWKDLFRIEQLRGWLIYVLTKAVDESVRRIVKDFEKEMGIELYYECSIEDGYTSCKLKISENCELSIFNFYTDEDGEYTFSYNNFLNQWERYVDLIEIHIDMLMLKKKENGEAIEPIDQLHNSKKYDFLKKLKNLMMSEFADENNKKCNFLSEILYGEFRNFGENSKVEDKLISLVCAR